ncbi:NUDIX hydrolase [Polynucleobacter brandtiae]
MNPEITAKAHGILNSLNPFARNNTHGHITASGLVIHEEKVLLIFHPYIKEWFQPGGHIDVGETPIDAAIREVYEETGVVCVADAPDSNTPLDIDLHMIPANPQKGEGEHLDIDLLFSLRVLEIKTSTEKMEQAWIAFDAVENSRVRRALEKLRT